MTSREQPLLARPPSESSRGAEEEDALLTGQPTYKTESRKQKYREIFAWTWAALVTVVAIILAIVYAQEKSTNRLIEDGDCGGDKEAEGKRNLIFMVSDGMGPASLQLARSFRQYVDGLEYNDTLTLDKHMIGQSRTRSTSSLVSDSAAGATAFTCGFKTYNRAISVLPDGTPCGTVLEAAKRAGYMTGLVVTTTITDATPACFGSHVADRGYYDLIAEQLLGYYPLGRMVDVIIGGGRCHFLPNTDNSSCRADDKNLVAKAKEDGWTYIDNMADFNSLDPIGGIKLPLLALMADKEIPYEIDRRYQSDQYPSQYEMAMLALHALKAATTDSSQGFFIMIEGSRIDDAAHANDPAAQVHETLMHDKTFAGALDFVQKDSINGLVLSTSDHETGGLTNGRQLTSTYPVYRWFPSVLAAANHSTSHAYTAWSSYLSTPIGLQSDHATKSTYLNNTILPMLGITNATTLELNRILLSNSLTISTELIMSDILSRRAEIGWSTEGHTGVDVNIYGSDRAYMSSLQGNRENTDIGRFLARYLGVETAEVTDELMASNITLKPVSVDVSLGGAQRYA